MELLYYLLCIGEGDFLSIKVKTKCQLLNLGVTKEIGERESKKVSNKEEEEEERLRNKISLFLNSTLIGVVIFVVPCFSFKVQISGTYVVQMYTHIYIYVCIYRTVGKNLRNSFTTKKCEMNLFLAVEILFIERCTTNNNTFEKKLNK